MKILHISGAISWRGGEQQLFYLQDSIQSTNIEQIIACPYNSVLHKRLENKTTINLRGFKKGVFSNLFCALRLKQASKQEKVDFIHVHDSHSHTSAFISAWLMGNKTPIIVSRRVDFPIGANRFSKLKYNHKSIRQIICVSEAIKEIMSRDILDKSILSVIHSGIDLSRFPYKNKTHKLRTLLSLNEDTIIIGNTSAIAPHKDYYTFVDTAAIILKTIPHAHFVIIGSGPLEKDIKDYVLQKELTNSFSFTGFRNDIHELLPDFDIFLMTSTTEGLGTSLLDAFACNVPVVTTNAGGISEIIEHNITGLLTPIGKPKQLAQGVIKLMNDTILRQSITERASHKLNDFNKKETANKIINAYKRL